VVYLDVVHLLLHMMYLRVLQRVLHEGDQPLHLVEGVSRLYLQYMTKTHCQIMKMMILLSTGMSMLLRTRRLRMMEKDFLVVHLIHRY